AGAGGVVRPVSLRPCVPRRRQCHAGAVCSQQADDHRLESDGRAGRRRAVGGMRVGAGMAGLLVAVNSASGGGQPETGRATSTAPVRGIYGGVPQEILDTGRTLRAFGVDAVWLGSGSITPERLALLRAQGVQVFAEFNTLHVADFLKTHP